MSILPAIKELLQAQEAIVARCAVGEWSFERMQTLLEECEAITNRFHGNRLSFEQARELIERYQAIQAQFAQGPYSFDEATQSLVKYRKLGGQINRARLSQFAEVERRFFAPQDGPESLDPWEPTTYDIQAGCRRFAEFLAQQWLGPLSPEDLEAFVDETSDAPPEEAPSE